MNIIFAGTTGVHYALVAAFLYLGQVQSGSGIEHLPGFGDMALELKGVPIYLGTDSKGNRVFSLGLGKQDDMGMKIINGLLAAACVGENSLIIKKINIPEAEIFCVLGKLASIPGGQWLNKKLSVNLINRRIAIIQKQIEEFKRAHGS